MKKDNRFEIKREHENFLTDITIIVDKKTGINYIFYSEGYAGGLTVLLDEDGKPVITK